MTTSIRRMPNAPFAERAVLRILLLSEREEIASLIPLTLGDFWAEPARVVYTAARAVVESGARPTLARVRQRLTASGNFARLPPGYLDILTAAPEDLPAAAMDLRSVYEDELSSYLDTIEEAAIAREGIRESEELRSELHSPQAADDLADVLNERADRLEMLSARISGREGVGIGRCLTLAYQSAEKAHKNPAGLVGIPSGFDRLDHFLLGWRPQQLYLLAGRPGMGKSALALRFAIEAARIGRKAHFISLEMSEEVVGTRVLAAEARVDGLKLQAGRLKSDGWSKVTEAIARLSRDPLTVLSLNPLSLGGLMNYARRQRQRGELDILFVDYLQLLEPPRYTRKGTRVEQIGGISRGLKRIAAALDIPVVALSQLNRASVRAERPPRVDDLEGSGALEQDATGIMLIDEDRDDDGDPIFGQRTLILDKNRLGPVGDLPLQWIPQWARYQTPTLV